MTVWLNGEPLEVADGASVDDVTRSRGVPGRGVAVAVDGAVLPRASWPHARLSDGARLEVLTAVQGG